MDSALVLNIQLNREKIEESERERKIVISRFFVPLQTLVPSSSAIDFTVERITASPEGSYLALSGSRGVAVLELPGRWGPSGQYKEGKERILCR